MKITIEGIPKYKAQSIAAKVRRIIEKEVGLLCDLDQRTPDGSVTLGFSAKEQPRFISGTQVKKGIG